MRARPAVRRGIASAALAGLLMAALAGAIQAQQGGAPSLLKAARQQYDEAVYDSALTLVEAALGASPNLQERAWAFSLRALLRLAREDVVSARQDFLRGYETDARLMSDSFRLLTDLHSEAGRVLSEAHQTYVAQTPAAEQPQARPQPAAPAVVLPPLTVQVDVPADTVLAPLEERLPVLPRPSRRASATATISPSDAPTVVLWSDTLRVGAPAALGWNLHDQKGNVVSSGRYTLRVIAMDSVGEVSPPVERVLVVTRTEPDTQPLPPPLEPSAFEPETQRVQRGSPVELLVGAGLAAAAVLLPEALARSELTEGRDRDATQLVIGGSVTLASIVGFWAGHHERTVPEAVSRNAELRRRDATDREAIIRANAEVRANAPVRVRLEASGP